MAYLTLPNSVTTATTVQASPLQGNFETIQTGLMCGSVDFNVDTLRTTETKVSGTMSTTNWSLAGADKGTRHLFVAQWFQSQVFGNKGSGYMDMMEYTNINAFAKQNAVHRAGCVTGYGMMWAPYDTAVATVSVALIASGTTFASNEFYLSQGVQRFYSTFVRGTYPFSAGVGFEIYITETTPGSATGYMATTLEVVYDD